MIEPTTEFSSAASRRKLSAAMTWTRPLAAS